MVTEVQQTFPKLSHDINCEWQLDQYSQECTCGLTRPRAAWFKPFQHENNEQTDIVKTTVPDGRMTACMTEQPQTIEPIEPQRMLQEDLNNIIRMLKRVRPQARVGMPGALCSAGELLDALQDAQRYREMNHAR